MARGLVGLTHGCVVWGDASDEETARPTVWTEDGLYVDELLACRPTMSPRTPTACQRERISVRPSPNRCGDRRDLLLRPEFRRRNAHLPHHRLGWLASGQRKHHAARRRDRRGETRRDGSDGRVFQQRRLLPRPALTRTDKVVHFNWGEGGQEESPTRRGLPPTTSSSAGGAHYEAATNEDTRFEIRGGFPSRAKGEPLGRAWLGGELVFDSQPAGVQGPTEATKRGN